MNTATISPALDVLANKPASAQTSKTPEADNNSQSFADVLSHQHTSQASETGKRVEKDPSTPKDSSHPDARSNDDPANSELARLTAQSGITGSSGLPLISNLAGQTTLMHEGLRSQAAQLKEPGLAMANNNRQALASTALQTTVVDTNSTHHVPPLSRPAPTITVRHWQIQYVQRLTAMTAMLTRLACTKRSRQPLKPSHKRPL